MSGRQNASQLSKDKHPSTIENTESLTSARGRRRMVTGILWKPAQNLNAAEGQCAHS